MIRKTNLKSSSVYLLPGIECMDYNEHGIIKDVCKYFNVLPEDIRNSRRQKEDYTPRQVSMYFIKKMFPKYTLKYIGGLFDRDHATVLHADKTVKDHIYTEPEFRVMINEIDNIIQTGKYR